jgi:hypothetical protein
MRSLMIDGDDVNVAACASSYIVPCHAESTRNENLRTRAWDAGDPAAEGDVATL